MSKRGTTINTTPDDNEHVAVKINCCQKLCPHEGSVVIRYFCWIPSRKPLISAAKAATSEELRGYLASQMRLMVGTLDCI